MKEIPDDPLEDAPGLQRAVHLIGALCDERITAEQFRELESLVCTDQEVRRLYVQMMHVHAGLYYFASVISEQDRPLSIGEEPAEEKPALGMNESMVMPAMKEPFWTEDDEELPTPAPVAAFPAPKPAVSSGPYLLKGGIAAILTIGLGLLAYFVPSINTPPRNAYTSPLTKPEWYVANIELSATPTWDVDPPHGGNFMTGESLILKNGVVQLRLRRGGRLVVEGPADVRFVSEVEIGLERGRIAATFPGGGLVVRCPSGSIQDLGTQFGVSVNPVNGSTEVEVFEGRVAASLSSHPANQPAEPVVLNQGQAAILSGTLFTKIPQGAIPQRYICSLQDIQLASLDVADLISGGDGTTRRRGIAVDAVNGDIGVFTPAMLRVGDGKYHPVHGIPVVDGAFIPDGTHGAMEVDSGGDKFSFPPTTNTVTNQIWTGGSIPWGDALGISTSFGGEDFSTPKHSLLCTHCNNAITLDLNAVRHLYPRRKLTRFHANVGNSYVNGLKGAIKVNPVASVYILMDGKTRYEKIGFTNQDGLIAADIPISQSDHFITLAAVDDGKEIDRDWILWTDAKLDIAQAN